MKIAFLTNGPGEAWTWCRPLILEARNRVWQPDVHLLPCPYASGREYDALSSLPAEIYRYNTSATTFKSFALPKGYDAVVQLGGDLMFGRFLAWREKAPLFCYAYGKKQGMAKCDKIMTAREGLIPCYNAEVVGDLVLDSLDPGAPEDWTAPSGRRIAVFPGSRPNIRNKAFYFLQEIRSEILKKDPLVELRVLLSPFVNAEEIGKWRDEGFSVWTGTTPAGIFGADLALTQPGTNTIELMYLEQPMAIAIPYSFLRLMPLSGLIGMIDKIPVLGASLREYIIRKKLPAWIGHTAWPNRLVKETFVPELIGDYTGAQLAGQVLNILSDIQALELQRGRLRELKGQVMPGSPKRICDIIERLVAERND